MKQDKRKKSYYFILPINNDFARHFEKSPKRDMTSYWHEDWTTDFLVGALSLLLARIGDIYTEKRKYQEYVKLNWGVKMEQTNN